MGEIDRANLPEKLRRIFNPPAKLYFEGEWPDESRPHLAVVGSRKPTQYGMAVLEYLIEPVARAGVVIVSGLAYGIDKLAHETTLKAGGTTIAVLGSGLDKANFYPASHFNLGKQIVQNGGLLISEYPEGSEGLKYRFVERNRLIAGLADATLIIEAADQSGSLITAQLALNENRDVWAVPGSIFSELSFGTNRLIQNGAKLVASPKDILEAFNLESEVDNGLLDDNLSDIQRKIVIILTKEQTMHINDMSAKLNEPLEGLAQELLLLELEAIVAQVAPGEYIRKR